MARTRPWAIDEVAEERSSVWRARGEMALVVEGKWAGPGRGSQTGQGCAGTSSGRRRPRVRPKLQVLRLECENELSCCLCRAASGTIAERAFRSVRNKICDISTQEPALFQHQKGDCQAATIGRFGVVRREHNVDTLPIAANHTRATAQ